MGRKLQLISTPTWNSEEPRIREIDLEDWDRDRDLLARCDWEGLIRHRRRRVLTDPRDVSARTELGEAYVLAGRPRRALAVLREAYRLDPKWPELPPVILEALFALGRDERDFDWVRRPAIARLDESALLRCETALRERRANDLEGEGEEGGEMEVWDLYEPFLEADWTTFGAWDLLRALRRDGRFAVRCPEAGPEALVSLR